MDGEFEDIPQAVKAVELEYASAGKGLDPKIRNRWRIAAGVATIYFVCAVVQIVIYADRLPGLLESIWELKWDGAYLVAYAAYYLTAPVVIGANGLAMVGCWAAARRGTGRNWFFLYVVVQLAALALYWGLLTYLIRYGEFEQITAKVWTSWQVGARDAGWAAERSAWALPWLLVLLVPKVRRACFAREA